MIEHCSFSSRAMDLSRKRLVSFAVRSFILGSILGSIIMNRQHILLSLVLLSTSGIASLFTAIDASAQATKTASVRFVCGKDSLGAPATMVEPLSSQKPSIPVIRWTSKYFASAGFPPAKRCEMVSKKFQDAYTKNPNFVFTTAILKGEPVVCSAANRGGACETMLYTIKRGAQDPIITMLRLEKVRAGASGALNESSGGSGEASVGVQELLTNLLSNNQSSTTPAQQGVKPKGLW
jgi:Circadian oscillating protein COP23